MKPKKLTLSLLLVFSFCISIFAQKPYRIMTYNVHNAIGMDGVTDCERIAKIIRENKPDVVALQELDSVTDRSQKKYILGEIAMRTGMYPSFSSAIDFQGGKYGIGILSEEKPLKITRKPLPGTEENRTFIMAEFADYVFCCTHLSLTDKDRITSIDIIKNLLEGIDKPVFLAGDFNDTIKSEMMKETVKHFDILSDIKQNTYPSDNPNVTIDYIMSLKQSGIKIQKTYTKVIEEKLASDHRPIIADVKIAQKTEKIFKTRPYLQNPVNKGITVMWETTAPSYSWVEYGTDTLNLNKVRVLTDGQAVCNNTLNKIRINNLIPGKQYYYRICSQEIMVYKAYNKVFGNTAKSEFYTFKLPDEKQDKFTAVIFNDLHKQFNTFKALCKQIKDVSYDFAVFNGDCVDDPSNRDEATAFISEMINGIKGYNIPVFFIRGNHEIRNAYSIELRSHYDYVGDKTYSAFNWGDTRFVILDCGEDKPDDHWVYYGLNDFTQLRNDQVDFMRKEFSSKDFKKAARRVLLHHIPLYGNDRENQCYDLWNGILKKTRFDISINAHTHEFAAHEKGTLGNNYPVVIGGGYSMDSATVIILSKDKDNMHVKVLSANGEVLYEKNL